MADHPCSADHKKERNALILRFQHIAERKHLRISFMSGDVHATANSRFKSTKKVDPSQDPKFMLQSKATATVIFSRRCLAISPRRLNWTCLR